MDVLRYMRAMQARHLETVWERKQQAMKKDGKVKATELSAEDWEQILEIDTLLQAFKDAQETK